MRTMEEQKQREQETEELMKAPVGTKEYLGCSECEGLEEHVKLEDGTWKCTWCGAEVIKLKKIK